MIFLALHSFNCYWMDCMAWCYVLILDWFYITYGMAMLTFGLVSLCRFWHDGTWMMVAQTWWSMKHHEEHDLQNFFRPIYAIMYFSIFASSCNSFCKQLNQWIKEFIWIIWYEVWIRNEWYKSIFNEKVNCVMKFNKWQNKVKWILKQNA